MIGVARARRFALRWLVFAAGVAVWELAATAAGDTFFPPPSQIAGQAVRMWFSGPPGRLFLTSGAVENLLPSLGRMLLGLAISAVLGIGGGLAIGRSAQARDFLDPLTQFFRAIPPPTLVAVFIVIFRIGTQMEVATIVFGTVWPMLLNTTDGARSVDPLQLDTAAAFRLTRAQRLFRVIVPAAAPKIFAGLRLALSLALILMVFSELVGSTNGIGYQMIDAQTTFDLKAMWAAVVLLGVLGYVMNSLLLLVERSLLRWHRASRLGE